MFHIVEFLDSQEVDIIPTNWLNSDQSICSWPNYKSTSKLTHSAKVCEPVSENWKKYPIKVLKTFDDYESARKKLPETDLSSDSVSEISENRSTNQPVVMNYDEAEAMEESDSNMSNIPFVAGIPEFLKTDSRSNILPDDGPACTSSTTTICQPLSESEINSSVVDSNCNKHQICNQALLKLMTEIKQTAELHTYMLKQILSNNSESESSQDVVSTNPPPFLLPLTTFESIEGFNTYLRNENNFKSSCSYFATFGGRNTKETVKLIVKYLLTDEAGLLFTWEGRRGSKKAFKEMTKICELVYTATIRNPRCKGATITEVYDQMKSWIKYAMMRIERSKLRAVSATSQE